MTAKPVSRRKRTLQMAETPRLVLASQSKARRAMLENAGVAFECAAAPIDEVVLTAAYQSGNRDFTAAGLSGHLACRKALVVSEQYPGAYVIGADQVVADGDKCFSKVATMGEAREVLVGLRGRTHELVSAVVLVKDGAVLWQNVETAKLTMRDFSDAFLDSYLDRAGERVLWSAGCYELEGLGVQLFEEIEGDYFTILGMPLLSLLGELRRRGLTTT